MTATLSVEDLDNDAIERYGIRGQSYASFPTTLSFDTMVNEAHFNAALFVSNEELIPANLTFHVHIPFCRSLCHYCGCSKKVTRNPTIVNGYMTMLHHEIMRRASQIDDDRVVDNMHWGGGTPTTLNAGQRESLMQCFQRHFHLSDLPDRDFSIDIDPRMLSPDDIGGLHALGFNRINIGVQDFSQPVQAAINRRTTPDQVNELTVAAREAGIESVSLDLMYGLPQQSARRLDDTLDLVMQMRPDMLRITRFIFQPKRFAAQRLLDSAGIPDAETQFSLFLQAMVRLVDAGYEFFGMDQFALPDSSLAIARRNRLLQRNFQGYQTGAGNDVHGFGVSAISDIGGNLFQTHSKITDYARAVGAGHAATVSGRIASADDRRVDHVVQKIMCYGRCDKVDWNTRFRGDFDRYFRDELLRLESLQRDGLVDCRHDQIRITAKGRVFLKAVVQCFDPRSEQSDAGFWQIA